MVLRALKLVMKHRLMKFAYRMKIRNFSQLFAARAAIGIGEAGYAPGGTAIFTK
jgi:hypothetical protein